MKIGPWYQALSIGSSASTNDVHYIYFVLSNDYEPITQRNHWCCLVDKTVFHCFFTHQLVDTISIQQNVTQQNWPPEVSLESTPSDRWFTGCNKASWSATTSPISANVKYLQPLTAVKIMAAGNIYWQSCGLDMIGVDDVSVAYSGKLLSGWDCMLQTKSKLTLSNFCYLFSFSIPLK